MEKNLLKYKLIMASCGVFLGGISVGLFKRSIFGTDPFQVLANGLSNQIQIIDFGTLYMIMNVLMLVCILVLDKHYIGIATFINVFFYGYIIQFSESIVIRMLGENPGLGIRIVLLVLGIVIMCFGTSLYFTADLGVSTYDAISLIMFDKKLGKFKYLRISTDLFCVIVGYFLGGIVGIGTLLTAFFMGPLIDFFNIYKSKKILSRVS
jgi:uncharacterized membrane protein YczE